MSYLQNGKSVALVSDAGTPMVSDPGLKLVRACADLDIAVIPIPGASAMLAGVVTAGLPTDKLFFSGFLPTKPHARRSALTDLAKIDATLVFFESGSRLLATLNDMANIFGSRHAAVGRELTKLHESLNRAPLEQLAATYKGEQKIKGECVVVVEPPPPQDALTSTDVDEALREALKTLSVKDAAGEVAGLTGESRRTLYARALALAKSQLDAS